MKEVLENMHTIKLQVHDNIYEHIIFLLKNLNTKELKIVEDSVLGRRELQQENDGLRAFSDHSANIIKEWQDDNEDNVWK